MPTFDAPRLLDALSAPMGSLIASVGRSVAEAQRDLDAQTIALHQSIYAENEGLLRELQRIGYRPTWYHIPSVEAELQVALTVTGEYSETTPARSELKVYAAPVDAGYTSRFNYELKASSTVRFKIVPVPESPAAEQIRVVPAVVGETVARARELLDTLLIPFTVPDGTADTALVTTQAPAAGTVLAGETVALGV